MIALFFQYDMKKIQQVIIIIYFVFILGFSFVLFESPDGVVNATKERFHKVNGKMVSAVGLPILDKLQNAIFSNMEYFYH